LVTAGEKRGLRLPREKKKRDESKEGRRSQGVFSKLAIAFKQIDGKKKEEKMDIYD